PIIFWTAYAPMQGEGNSCTMSIAADDLNHSPIKCGSASRFAERALRNIDSGSASLRLDVGCPDHLAPFFGFVGDELAKVCGRDDKRRHTKNGEPRFYLGIGEARVDLLVELVDDVRRRVLGYADAIPVARLIARHELTHGRDVRQRVRAGRGRHRQRTQPAVLNVLD